MTAASTSASLLDADPAVLDVQTTAAGPTGNLPLTEELLLHAPSGDLFGLTQDAGMGWNPAELGRKEFLILSTQGGIRAPDGRPIALCHPEPRNELLVGSLGTDTVGRRGMPGFVGAQGSRVSTRGKRTGQ